MIHRRFFLQAILATALLAVSSPAVRAQAPPFTILVTNDDGFAAPGLRALAEALKPLGEVIVAAPAQNQSGKGHSIVTSDPILVFERKQPSGGLWYAIEATPATCARLALDKLMPRQPDLVVSGINRGENLGIVVYYSGTLGAAREAAMVGIPAIAVSMGGSNEADYAATAAAVRAIVEQLRAKDLLKPGLFLNVNAPEGRTKGVLVTRLSVKANEQLYERRVNPRGTIYYWPGYRPLDKEEQGTDVWGFLNGYITVTPMVLDATDTKALGTFKVLEKNAPAAGSGR
jgi:5'-nucleotidase